MACRNCGHEHADDAEVCPNCGADLTALHDAAAPAAEAAAARRANADAKLPPPAKPGAGRILAIVLIVVSVLLFALCGVYAVVNVVAIQQLHKRSAARVAITGQKPVPAPNTIGQTDPEQGANESDVATTNVPFGVPPGVPDTWNMRTPEAIVDSWFTAHLANDVPAMKSVVVKALDPLVDSTYAPAPADTTWKVLKVTTSGDTATVVVRHTAAATAESTFTLARAANGVWAITAIK